MITQDVVDLNHESDDRAPTAPSARGLGVAVVVDRARASALTGGATLLEQALATKLGVAAADDLRGDLAGKQPLEITDVSAVITDRTEQHQACRQVLEGLAQQVELGS